MGPALAKATDWAAVAAWAAWATVAVYVVLGIFASIQVLQARRLCEEQTRPFVFDKPLESTLSGPREIDESPLLRKPIPTLSPGSVLEGRQQHRWPSANRYVARYSR